MLNLSTGPRVIADGNQYNHLFPSFGMLTHTNPVVIRNGSVEDSVATMAQISSKFKNDTAILAEALRGNTVEQTSRNIWNFIYNNIQYQEDQDGVEQIRRPLRSWEDRQSGIDCDCMSVFASSVLKNLDIPHYFRITRYDQPDYQHVYVVVPAKGISGTKGYFTIDGVIGAFNAEKNYKQNKDFNAMNGIPIQVLNGLGTSGTSDPVYNFLVQTKQFVDRNPHATDGKMGCCDASQMVGLIVDKWNDPRGKSLAIMKMANIEANHYPNIWFFRKLKDYMYGRATADDVMQSSFLNGTLGSLGSAYGVGNNGDGTFYVYDDATGATLKDNMTSDAAYTYLNTLNSGATGNNSGTPGWLDSANNLINNLLNVFNPKPVPNSSTTNTKTTLPVSTPVIPAKSSAWSMTSILLTLGVIGGVGYTIYSLSDSSKKTNQKALKP